MQSLIALVFVMLQAAGSQAGADQSIFGNSYVLPEVVATAKRAPDNMESVFGNSYVLPEVVVTAKKDSHENNQSATHDNALTELPSVMALAYRHSLRTINPMLFLYDITPKLAFAEDTGGVNVEVSPHMTSPISGEFYVDTNETIDHDVSITGGTAVVDGVIDGDLAVMGGEAVVNGSVTGEVAVFGGNLRINGIIEEDAAVFGGTIKNHGTLSGDLAVIGGNVELDSGSTVSGDIVVIGGTVEQDSNAVIEGEIKTVKMPLSRLVPRISKLFRLGPQLDVMSAVVSRVVILGIIAVFYLLCLLALLIFPGAIEKINIKVRDEFWISLAIGVAIIIAIIPAIVLFAISIVGIPLIFLLPIALAVAGIFGFASLSSVVGKRICESAKWKIESRVGVFSIGWLALMAINIIAGAIHFPLITIIGISILWIAWTIGQGAATYTIFKKESK
ncbi:MAG TPA: polymer-forming cytoskeletal protein [bacterium]